MTDVQKELDLEQEPEVIKNKEDEEELDYEAEFNKTFGGGDDDDPPKPVEEKAPVEELAEPSEPAKPTEPVTPAEPAEPEKVDDPYAWIKSLPEDIKTQVETLKHSAESDRGRVSAYNRRLQELQHKLDRIEARPTQEVEEGAEAGSEPKKVKLPEKYVQLQEDFPEFADAVDAIREHDRAAYDKIVADRLQPLEKDRLIVARQTFKTEVSSGAEEIFKTKETGVDWQDIIKSNNFTTWLERQPLSVQRAAGTLDSTEAIEVLRRYEDDYQRSVTQEEDIKAEDARRAETQKADKLKQQRQSRQKESIAPSSDPAPTEGAEGAGDYEAEFNARWGSKK